MQFLDAILNSISDNKNVVIPDIKCYSPKEGDILQGRNPVEVALGLQNAGAPVISVVTEEKEFHGSMKLLREIADKVNVPILRKDFIHTKQDLVETIENGASAILLMCSCLKKEELEFLYNEALGLGLDPFVETHTLEEMEFAKSLGAKLIGINNRNILELERDDGTVNTTIDLVKHAPKDAVLISESSIKNASEVRRSIEAGCSGVLVGTAIWQAKNPYTFYKCLCSKTLVKICGNKSVEDVNLCMENGVEMLGFVVEYPKDVPSNLSVNKAKSLINTIGNGYLSCIVTGGEQSKIISIIKELKPDYIQLHYKETFEDIVFIKNAINDIGVKIIKAFPISKEDKLEQFGETQTLKVIRKIEKAGADAILVDPRNANNANETGFVADLELFDMIKKASKLPVILAGGINNSNISDIMEKAKPIAIDIMSGVEISHKKDREKLERFMSEILA